MSRYGNLTPRRPAHEVRGRGWRAPLTLTLEIVFRINAESKNIAWFCFQGRPYQHPRRTLNGFKTTIYRIVHNVCRDDIVVAYHSYIILLT